MGITYLDLLNKKNYISVMIGIKKFTFKRKDDNNIFGKIIKNS